MLLFDSHIQKKKPTKGRKSSQRPPEEKKARYPRATLTERKVEKLFPIRIKGISSFIKGGCKESYLSGT